MRIPATVVQLALLVGVVVLLSDDDPHVRAGRLDSREPGARPPGTAGARA